MSPFGASDQVLIGHEEAKGGEREEHLLGLGGRQSFPDDHVLGEEDA